MEDTIIIKSKSYKVKRTLRSIFMFEDAVGHKISSDATTMETFLYFFCLLYANNKNLDFDFDMFITYCDEDPEIQKQFLDWIVKSERENDFFQNTENQKKVPKAKK